MPVDTFTCTSDAYRWSENNGGSWAGWYTNYNNSGDSGRHLPTGRSGIATDNNNRDIGETMLNFTDSLPALIGSVINSATLKVYRKDTYSEKTWALKVVNHEPGASSPSYNVVSGSPTLTKTISQGVGWKSLDITSLMPYLVSASADRRILLTYSGTGNSYGEIWSREHSGGYGAQLVVNYTQGTLRFAVGNEWKQCEVFFALEGRWQKVQPHFAVDGQWKILGG